MCPWFNLFSSVAQSCPTPWDPMDCSMPSSPVHHHLPELAQIHVHWIGNAIQWSPPLSSPSPPTFNLSQYQGLFQWVGSSHQVAKVLEFQLQHQSFHWIFSLLNHSKYVHNSFLIHQVFCVSLFTANSPTLALHFTDFKNKPTPAPSASIMRMLTSILLVYSNLSHPSRPGLILPPARTPPSHSIQQFFCQQKQMAYSLLLSNYP